MTIYKIDESSVFTEVKANYAFTLNSVNTSCNWDAQLLKYRFTKPANHWVEAM